MTGNLSFKKLTFDRRFSFLLWLLLSIPFLLSLKELDLEIALSESTELSSKVSSKESSISSPILCFYIKKYIYIIFFLFNKKKKKKKKNLEMKKLFENKKKG